MADTPQPVPIPEGATVGQAAPPTAASQTVPIPEGATVADQSADKGGLLGGGPGGIPVRGLERVGEIYKGIGEGALKTVAGAGNLLAKATGLYNVDDATNAKVQSLTTATTPEEKAGQTAESVAEWMGGDAVVKGLARLAGIAKSAPWLLEVAERYPTISKILLTAGETAKGAVVGGAQAAVKAPAEGRDVKEAAAAGAKGGAIGGAVTGTLESLASTEFAQKLINKSLGLTGRDVVHGNAGKALLDEGILSPSNGSLARYQAAVKSGASHADAIAAAGGRVEDVSRVINTLSPQLDDVLQKSGAKISVIQNVLDPLTQASVELTNNPMVRPDVSQAVVKAIDAWRDNIRALVGIKDIPATEALALKRQLAGTLNWTKNAAVDDVLEEVSNKIYANLKNAIHTAVPAARPLDERLSNLLTAWDKLNPGKSSGVLAQELAGRSQGISGGNVWDVPQRVLADIGRLIPGIHAAAANPLVKAAVGELGERNLPGLPPEQQLPQVPEGHVRFRDSAGAIHDVPQEGLAQAKQIDPGLQVIQ